MATPSSTSPAPDSGALTYLTRRRCPVCSHVECTAVCRACGTFKFPPQVTPAAEPPPAPAGDAYTSCLAAEIQLRRLLARNQARAAA